MKNYLYVLNMHHFTIQWCNLYLFSTFPMLTLCVFFSRLFSWTWRPHRMQCVQTCRCTSVLYVMKTTLALIGWSMILNLYVGDIWPAGALESTMTMTLHKSRLLLHQHCHHQSFLFLHHHQYHYLHHCHRRKIIKPMTLIVRPIIAASSGCSGHWMLGCSVFNYKRGS